MKTKYVEIKAYGSDENLSRLIQVLKTMEALGRLGCSRTLQLWVDGDGAAQMYFDFGKTNTDNVEVPKPDSDILLFYFE